MPRLHARVSGRVQGVGFRYFTQSAASKLNLTGWVRNLRNGDVEAEVEGPRDSLQAFLDQLRSGPSLARVTNVDERWEDQDGRYSEFQVKPTA